MEVRLNDEFGVRNSLYHVTEQVRNNILQPQCFRFFLGFLGWELDQLKNEIALRYWVKQFFAQFKILRVRQV